ncbi:hypothetical protein INS49_013357 [Diaporthe citri]|uniref:uncharacterized protein n=1 Tax=Diaporthe citri TaxID=83186 RepID=UPI001C80699D|nr:uncharacterized protein INS49_013357 [Diaporthe citri]KAG6357480.1 hypothetical protein INS49_013357 [Diaporthe citri]
MTSEWSKTIYRSDEAASPMGCIQQYQYCNAEHKCGELASFYDAMITAAPFLGTPLDQLKGYVNASGRTSSQFIWFERIMYSGYDLASLIKIMRTSALASRSSYAMGTFGQIPNNQWKLDVTHWWTALLAAKQTAFVSVARGPRNPLLLQSTGYPENEYMKQLCHSQKVRSTKYTSFSLFGLYFTFTTGAFIMLISYLLEPIFQYLARRHKYEEYKYIEWTGDETLQLQRMAYQGLGSEAWSGYTDSVPKTRPGYFLADLHLAYSHDENKEVVSDVQRSAQPANTQYYHADLFNLRLGSTSGGRISHKFHPLGNPT